MSEKFVQSQPLEILWDQYCCRLLAFIRRRVSNDADAEDILQEVFIRVHRSLCCSNAWNKPESWIYQVTRNLIIDYYRRRRDWAEIPEDLAVEAEFDQDDPNRAAGAFSPGDHRHAARAVPPCADIDRIPGPQPEGIGRASGFILLGGKIAPPAGAPQAARYAAGLLPFRAGPARQDRRLLPALLLLQSNRIE